MSYYITNELFPHRVSHAVVGSSNLNGSGIGLAGDGLSLAGDGFGKGTRRKILKTAGKVARSGLGLVKAFGTDEQKAQAATAEQAYDIVQGAGRVPASASKKPGAKLRKMMC
jgi:hypothetical protein